MRGYRKIRKIEQATGGGARQIGSAATRLRKEPAEAEGAEADDEAPGHCEKDPFLRLHLSTDLYRP